MRKMILGLRFVALLTGILVTLAGTATCCYSDVKLRNIPSNHLYWKLKKPLVIGHMGNVKEYQENTLEGIQSLIAINADGVHMQVQLTKDNKLVLLSEDNLKRMTGEDYSVSRLPFSEIQKMNIQKTITYQPTALEKIERTYRSTLKIPLLTSALDIMHGKNMLLYIEMLNDPVPTDPLARQVSDLTAKTLSDIINQYQIHSYVFVVSKNPFTLKSLNSYDSSIVTGWWLDNNYMYTPTVAEQMRTEYIDLLGNNCFNGKPNGTLFTKYLLTSGIISKSINASIVDLSISIYTDKKYYGESSSVKELRDIIQDSYGNITLGGFDVFPFISTDLTNTSKDVAFIVGLYKKGVNRFITSDVNRVKTALNEVAILHSTANTVKYYFVFIVLTLLFGKLIIALMFL